MPVYCCFSYPQQLFFEPMGRGNALSLPKHPIATRSGLKVHPGCSKPQPDRLIGPQLSIGQLDFLAPSLLYAFLFQSRFRFFGNIESFSNFQPKFNQPKNRKKLAGGSGIKTRGKSSKIWKCYTTIDRSSLYEEGSKKN